MTRKLVGAFEILDPELPQAERVAWRMIINDLPGDQARLLPQAVADALPAIAGLLDNDRLLLMMRLVVAFDVVECVGALGYLARQKDSPEAAIAAAALASNPGVSAGFAEQVGRLATQVTLSERQLAVFESMHSPDSVPTTSASARIRAERWPRTSSNVTNAVVGVEQSDAAPAAGMWLLISELHAAGAVVRRVFPPGTGRAAPDILPLQAVCVGWEQESFRPAPSAYVRAPAELFDRASIMSVLEAISSQLGRLQDASLDLEDSPRFLRAGVPEMRGGKTADNLAWARSLDQVKRMAYKAVIRYLSDHVALGVISYDDLLAVGRQSAADIEFSALLRESLVERVQDAWEKGINDAVASAVRELLRSGRIERDATRNTLVLTLR